ncbi:MAG: branched-chain amino acid ABC transporter permease [Candidatus Rokubacteria bacterium]|nr:branched-chain amino acid ABC transporter permease [Candidatus Rokubacteria bacterium]
MARPTARFQIRVLVGLAAAVAVIPLVVRSGYVLGMLNFIGLNAIAAMGLTLLMGFAGQVSLGQAAFFGLGAYTSGVLTATYGWNPWLAMGVAVILTGCVAFVIGVPIFRLSGLLLAMATLGLGIIVYYVLVNWTSLTGGPSGLTGIPSLSLWSFRFDSDSRFFYLVWGTVFLLLAFALNLTDSRVGRALRAIHGGELAAQVAGVDTTRLKLQIFVVSAVYTAIAGSLYAHYLTFINPSPFGFGYSIELLVMVVLGGLTSLWGALLGAGTVTLLVELLRAITPRLMSRTQAEYEIVLFGLLLMGFMIFLPRGLTGLARRS